MSEPTSAVAPLAVDATPTSAADPTQAAASPQWHDGVPGINDKDMESKSLEAYVQSTQSLRSMATAKGIPIPGENATAEQQGAFRTSVEGILGADAFVQPLPDIGSYDVPSLATSDRMSEERRAGIIKAFHDDVGITDTKAQKVMEMFGTVEYESSYNYKKQRQVQ